MTRPSGVSADRAVALRGKWFQCVYCRQGCSSYEILMSHEATCDHRELKKREWTTLRMKHLGRQRRGREWNSCEEFR